MGHRTGAEAASGQRSIIAWIQRKLLVDGFKRWDRQAVTLTDDEAHLGTESQTFGTACANFVRWLDQRVLTAGRGDDLDQLDVDPASTFWLGRLAPEAEVMQNPL